MTAAARPITESTSHATLTIAAMLLFALAWGVSLALGGLDAFFVCISIIGSLAVLFDFRVGAVLLILLLPVSESSLFPHSILGFTGLNPMNLLAGGTLISLLLHWKGRQMVPFVPRPLLWLYVIPIAIGGLIGSQHVDAIPSFFYDQGGLNFTDGLGYLRDILMKPLLTVLVALFVAAAIAKAKKPERFLVPIIAAVWIMALLEIQYVAFSGIRISELASANERGFFAGLGLHANDLGRLYAVAYALLLFVWW